MSEQWRYIPGYGDRYEIDCMGEIRSCYWRGSKHKKYHYLRPFRKQSTKSHPFFVKLTDANGRGKDITVTRCMELTWLPPKPSPKHVVYHKNGDLSDNCLNNLGYITRVELGKISGARSSRREPVAQIDPDSGEIVRFFPSARQAAIAGCMSYQTVIDRCNRPKDFKNPIAPDGYIYRWEDLGPGQPAKGYKIRPPE